jgi:phosphatidate cytidylyltransferase
VVGRTWGRRKLCPDISPNKTLEGAAGGVIAGTLGGLLFSLLLLPSVNVVFIIVAAVILTVTGIIGDLTESIVKRGTGTKDSGKCLGGHGGILDRVDSLLFVGPLFYYLLVFWM